jgi:hypothetical protein
LSLFQALLGFVALNPTYLIWTSLSGKRRHNQLIAAAPQIIDGMQTEAAPTTAITALRFMRLTDVQQQTTNK